MARIFTASLLAFTLVGFAAVAQDGPLRRVGRALDNTGKNIRGRIETEVARGQITAQEREVLHRVARRIEWDKKLAGSALQLEARPGGVMVVRGSVADEAAKARAIDMVENTVGVTSVVVELAVVKEVRVIEPKPVVIESEPVLVPAETKVIVKP